MGGMYKHTALIVLMGLMLGQVSIGLAQDVTVKKNASSVRLDEGYGNAFLNYEPYVREKPQDEKRSTTAPTVVTQQTKKDENQTVNVEWLRKNYPVLEQRAIDDPSEANVSAYLYAKRIILDKSQRFSNMVTKVTNEDPLLNENNRVPYASAGAQAVRRADTLAQRKAVEEMAKTGGLVVFVDSTCRFCADQLPVVDMLKDMYHIEALVVSLDGAAPKGYAGKIVKDNGLWKKLELKLTPSIVFVNRPQAFTGPQDPNTYLIVAQGFYAADELSKQIAYAGFKSSLLSDATRRDLDIWNDGVASTEDLQALRLDPNQPAAFKATLAPLLLKQYQNRGTP